MTRDEFLLAVEQDLRSRGAPFEPRDLIAYVEGCWPLMQDNPDVPYWADRFLEARRLLAGA
jgi:hypothetical protein